ncbi:cytochrome P450 [Spirillospora sp. CA-253888]
MRPQPSPQSRPRYLDVLDPSFDAGSAAVRAARRDCWYARSPIGPLVLRHGEARRLLRDRRLDHDGRVLLEQNGIFDGPVHDWFTSMITHREGDDHRRLRALLNKAFSPAVVEGLRPFVRATAHRLTDRLAEAGAGDFVAAFGDRLPLEVMSRMFGVPPDEHDRFRAWSADIGLIFALAVGGDVPARVHDAVVGLNAYAERLIERPGGPPAGGLVQALVDAYRGGGLSRAELRNLLVALVFGAHDTTRDQLANAMVAFTAHPRQWTLLARHPGMVPQAVDEVMRWCPSSTTLRRVATRDLRYQGLDVPRGTQLTVCTAIAQRDPDVFGDADRFDITAARPPGAVLQFGAGPHHCLGAALARAQLCEALLALTGRLGPPTATAPFTWRSPIGIRGPESLFLSFAPPSPRT